MHQVADKLPCIHTGYRPTFWCFPSTLNTILFAMIQRCVKVEYKREILKTEDGGQIALDWVERNLDESKKLILLILPGLTGSSKDSYVTHLADEASKAGCRAVIMNYRGIECELSTPRTYCATNYDDLHLVVSHIAKLFKDHKLMAVGVSLGGLKLGGYLSKHYDDCSISNAMIVSAPMNVFYTCEELEKTQNFFLFNRFLARNLSRYFHKYKHLFETDQRFDCSTIARCSSIRDFDTHFVSKQFGYSSVEEYYKDGCLDAKISNIRTPTLFLNAGDDMFSPERAFPIDKIKSNPYTAMVWTKYGGHISFCEGVLPVNCNYTCRLLRDYISLLLSNQNQVLEPTEVSINKVNFF